MDREGGHAHASASGPDLAVILDTVEHPILVISPDCSVIRFNRAATTLLHLKPEDVGRSAGDALTGISDLDKLCAQVMSDQTQHRLEIREGDRLFLLRIAPCNGPSGAVLTFTNVTAFRAIVDQAIYEREYTKSIFNTQYLIRWFYSIMLCGFRLRTRRSMRCCGVRVIKSRMFRFAISVTASGKRLACGNF